LTRRFYWLLGRSSWAWQIDYLEDFNSIVSIKDFGCLSISYISDSKLVRVCAIIFDIGLCKVYSFSVFEYLDYHWISFNWICNFAFNKTPWKLVVFWN